MKPSWAYGKRSAITPICEYKSKVSNGQPAGPPHATTSTSRPCRPSRNARMQSSEDLKATTGIYDAALGNRSNENSGVAIQRRSVAVANVELSLHRQLVARA
jgi:hypothetical protein